MDGDLIDTVIAEFFENKLLHNKFVDDEIEHIRNYPIFICIDKIPKLVPEEAEKNPKKDDSHLDGTKETIGDKDCNKTGSVSNWIDIIRAMCTVTYIQNLRSIFAKRKNSNI